MAKNKRRNSKLRKREPSWRSKQYEKRLERNEQMAGKKKMFFKKMADQLGVTPAEAKQKWYEEFGIAQPFDRV